MYLKKKLIGIGGIILAWELLSYSLCEYFIRMKVAKYVPYGSGAVSWEEKVITEAFNVPLFKALNFVGFSLLIFFISLNLLRQTKRSNEL